VLPEIFDDIIPGDDGWLVVLRPFVWCVRVYEVRIYVWKGNA
jgi:hypothetical protein